MDDFLGCVNSGFTVVQRRDINVFIESDWTNPISPFRYQYLQIQKLYIAWVLRVDTAQGTNKTHMRLTDLFIYIKNI